MGKQLQILKEAVPAASKIAYLCSYLDTGQWVLDSGQRLGIAVIRIPVEEATASQFRRAFAQMAQERLDAVMVSGAGEFLANRQPIGPIGPAGWDQVLGIFGPNYDSAIEHNAAELGEKAVTCCLDQPAVVSGDHRLEQFMSSFIA